LEIPPSLPFDGYAQVVLMAHSVIFDSPEELEMALIQITLDKGRPALANYSTRVINVHYSPYRPLSTPGIEY
jgi:hypothetical protein